MYQMHTPEILAVLPMRGDSKGIPKKSIYPVLGHPLAAYAMREALRSKRITRFVAYTDDAEMAEVAKKYGFEVPVQRPAEVSGDASTDIETFQRLLMQLKDQENYIPDIIVHLRATVPLFNVADIDRAIDMLQADAYADSVRGVCDVAATPFKMYWRKHPDDPYIDYFLRDAFPEIFAKFPEPSATGRQNFPTVWQHSGQVDVTRTSNISEHSSMSGKNILPFFLDRAQDIDIDDLDDIPYAEMLIRRMGRG